MSQSIHEFSVNTITGEQVSLSQYEGQVVLVVNTASQCGFTKQYAGLESLYKAHKDQGLAVLGFPCNQFGEQEKGDSDEISQFCELNFGVTFPLFEKIEVNGDNAAPLYNYLKDNARGILGSKRIKWNFTKFLVGKNGKVLKRYAPTTKPEAIAADIEKLL
ncbi:glutathione peroxidase [Psychrobium sp. MM17-31]|uniref:glutathione peroxidase n=1 Tax=Psychrobium sp. MM17-31 TaxID=2917758 RepID=UPI001EF5FB2F|nr:glutathione peroxidase [Psychrobium sp. MM17-31]MCG7530879.1 glutathione peroxidase [Psychrobium sp. MM17-31]